MLRILASRQGSHSNLFIGCLYSSIIQDEYVQIRDPTVHIPIPGPLRRPVRYTLQTDTGLQRRVPPALASATTRLTVSAGVVVSILHSIQPDRSLANSTPDGKISADLCAKRGKDLEDMNMHRRVEEHSIVMEI